MKVLWISNLLLPEQASYLGVNYGVNEGWVKAMADQLKELAMDELSIAFATVYEGDTLLSFEKDGSYYYLVPLLGKRKESYSKQSEWFWNEVYSDFGPDVVHIHGSEYAHGLAFINSCPDAKVVVSIQGVVSACARYYNEGLTTWEILSNITLNDIRGRESLFEAKKRFEGRAIIERQMFKSVKYAIGRTSWDKEQILAINPDIRYFSCNETLRKPFYNHSWSYERCEKHTIFFSQATYPLKGFHMLLRALPFVLKDYPDTLVYAAGNNLTAVKTLKQRLILSGYGRILRRIMKKECITDRIVFLGSLSSEEMCKCYLKSNVFVCCSSIENSPNSVCESQILGVPCVAPFVGGIPDLIPSKEVGALYDYKDISMLAAQIKSVFSAQDRIDTTVGSNLAYQRHDPKLNADNLLTIYKSIISD